ncbi:MAG: NAD-dependent epimerase/dehydratase family protein [Parvularculaceae bacterium]
MSDITLVTGGAGFAGRHLVSALRARGERVRIFDLAAPAEESDIQGSVTDAEAVGKAMNDVRSVFHLAGNAQLWSRKARDFDRVNRGGTEIVAEAALKAGVERFVYCSSLTTLVGKNTPIGESMADESIMLQADDMLGAYPRSKRMGEQAVEAAALKGLNAVIALPTEPLGPGDADLTPPTRMILDFLNGDTPAYIDCILNFVPVKSLAEGLIASRDRGRMHGRYLLGGENVPMRRLLETLERLSGRPMPKKRMPYAVAFAAGVIDTGLVARLTGEQPKAPLTGVRLAGRQVSFTSEKAARELGWRAAPFEDALAAAIEWLRDRGMLKARS